jgi:RNA polymerase sigma-70 factor (ECF subfamily)
VLDVVSEPLTDCGAPDREELQARLMTAIAALPGPQRDALLLQEQGFSLQEIASITGELEETVKSRLRYARRQLRELLGGEL